ncbi:hypothetical protein BDR05DRAFT_970149 [Suillus weaverae]|nr:hypothetical protein BDR05DRAFT_970149 [Suillus weaverae]
MSSCQAEYQSSRSPPLTIPKTHRLIPASSPTHGIIEANVPQSCLKGQKFRPVRDSESFNSTASLETSQHIQLPNVGLTTP